MARRYSRDWRGRFAGGGGGGGRPTGRTKAHGSRRLRKAGQVSAYTKRGGRGSKGAVSVIQRDRSGSRRVRQTTVRRPYSRLPIRRRTAIKMSAAATSRRLKRGQTAVVAKTNRRQTRIARRNIYLVTADT